MKNLLTLFAILCVAPSLFSQNTDIPAGEYFALNSGVLFSLRVAENGNYQISMADGKMEKTNGEVKLNMTLVDIPTFGLKYETRGSAKDSLTIKFDESFQTYYSNYIAIGTKNTATDLFEYKGLAEILDYQYEYDENLTEIKVAKTKYISFLEDKNYGGENQAYNYTIPEDVTSIILTYSLSAGKLLNLTANYDAKQDVVTISENGSSPLVFRKDYKKFLSGFETPSAIEKNVPYQDVEDAAAEVYQTSDGYEDYAGSYKFKLQQFDDYKKALQKNKEEKKILVVFNLPDNETSTKEYEDFIKSYEQYVSYNMYEKYNADEDLFNFYLAKNGDKNLKKQFKMEDNSMIALVNDGAVLVKQKDDFNTLTANFLGQSYENPDFKELYLMQRLDDLVTNKKFDPAATQNLFSQISKLNGYDGYYGETVKVVGPPYIEEANPDSEDEQNVVEEVKTVAESPAQYLTESKNGEYYKLKATQKEIEALYEKLIDSHKNDKQVDLQFADLVSHLLPGSYNTSFFKTEAVSVSNSDLAAIDYLLKFKTTLENYEPSDTMESTASTYYFYETFPYGIENALKTGIDEADSAKLQQLKPRFENLYDSKTEYLYFLQNYIPQEFLSEYKKIYISYFTGNRDIILQLNDIYETSKSDDSWGSFKSSLASQANSAAWSVVLDKNYNNYVKDAINWSKTSLNIDANNAYYLDTLAQLLYLNGDKQEAIKTQELAVKFQTQEISEQAKVYPDSNEYEDSTLVEMKDTLAQIKNGTYVQKENPQN